MAGTAVLLLCVFLGLTDTTTTQITDTTTPQITDTTTDEPSTLPTTTLPPKDSCFADWNVSVDKNFMVRWDGDDREATIFVNIVPIETYGEDCLKKLSFTAAFQDKEAPPVIDPPCFNSVYQVDVELRCGHEVARNYSTRIWTEPDAPSNVRVIIVTTSSFRVTWDKPPGTIEEYKVKVDSVEATTTGMYLDVKNLEPITEYKIQVSAKNSREWGKWSEEITIETKKIELPTPQNLMNQSVTNTTIEVAWDKVKFEDYQIGYCLRFGLGNKEKGLNTTGTSFTIKWLNPYTKYSIRVRAFTVGATGNWTETLAVTTLPGVPSEPEDVTEIGVDSVSIMIRWKEPSPSTGPITFYIVEWIESLSSMEVQQAVINTTFYTIKNLIPLTSYDISVSAATDAGLGNWTPAIQVKTKDPVPPENLRKASTSSNSISVEWDEPGIYKGRGIMIAYSVRWNKLSFQNRITPNTTNLSMTLDGLEPKTRYMFEVQGWTEKGSSAWSPHLLLETEVGVPDPPEKFSEVEVSNTSIEVKWDISKRYKNLVIIHTVEWSKMDNEDTNTVNTTKLSHLIENLVSYTNYSIRVKSWTVDGAGEWAGPIVIRTAIGVPLVPTNIKEDVVTNTSILVKWNEPLPMRGPIEMYIIKWQERSAKPVQNDTDVPFYLIEELTPYQNYSIQVSAKTQAGFGNWSDPIRVRTNAGIPLIPRNIKEDVVTNTSILVKWNEPLPMRGPIEVYFVEWQEEGTAKRIQKSTNVLFYLIEELTPYQIYSIRVFAKTEAGFGNWSQPITVRTNAGIPFMPRNIKGDEVTNTTISVKWDEPSPLRGPIELYLIEWQEKESAKRIQKSTNVPFYLIEELTPYQIYSIRVSAKTEAGFGNWSDPITVRTNAGIPFMPRNIKGDEVTNTTISVKWDEPSPLRGPIELYLIEWQEKESAKRIQKSTNVPFYLIEELTPYQIYSIRVSAKTEAGFGNWSDPITVRTNAGIPFMPRNIKGDEVTNTTILVKWAEPSPLRGPVELYLIEWQEKGSAKRIQKSTVVPFYLIEELTPYQIYSIRVSAKTEAGFGNWSDPITVRTNAGIPFMPRNIKGDEVTNTTILVKWAEPSPLRGPVELYLIEWQEKGSAKRIQKSTVVPFYLIEELTPYQIYSIRVSAKTEAGFGNWSDPITVRTNAGIPFMPRNIKGDEVTNTTILVKWAEPSPLRGPVELYLIEWQEKGSAKRIQKSTVVPFYLIEELTPYQIYSIRVSAKTEAGFGNWSDPITVRTNAGIPFMPRNIKGDEVTNTTILVKWAEPSPLRGPVELYLIEWQEKGSAKRIQKSTVVPFYLIEELTPYQIYSIRVSAKTEAGFGNWSDPITVRTNAGIPFMPRNIKGDEVTNTTILVKWAEPSPLRGPVELYLIEWQEKGSAKRIQKSTVVPFYLIEELTPYQIYSIRVSAKTEAGFGNWSDPITVRTNAGIPFMPRNIKGDEVTNTTILVKWAEPSPLRGPIEIYFIEWQDEGSAKRIQKSTVVPFYLIEELTPCRKYFIRVSAKTEAGLGSMSDPLTVSTTTGLPMVPKNVKISSSKTESLEIRWEEPEPHMGNIVSYSIRWGKRGDDLQFSDVTNGTSYIIGNLSAYTLYSVQVRASTEAGDGDWSKPVEGRTAIGIPSLPRDFQEKTNRTTNTSIEVEWEEPIPASGPITNYTVRWNNLDNNLMKSSITRETTYIIKELVPYTNYSVQVRAATIAGFGSWTDALVIRTETGVPFKPRNVKSVTVKETSVHLKWEEPEPMVGYITHYDVEWTDESTNSTVTEKPQNLYYIITNLSAYTNYTIRIRAATCAGSGDWSDPILVRTLSGVPLPPKNVEEGEVTNLTICIKWKEPSPFKGPILSYTVRWRHAISKTINTSSAETSSYCIQKLEPYTFYEIDVQAKTAAGFGAWSASKKIQTAVGIPTAVKHIESYNKTAWTIYLTWSPPEPPNGPLQDYEVKWGEYFKPEAMRNLTKATFFVAENLTPFTKYIFKVSASTKVGLGPPSDPFIVETEIAVPSAPVNLGLVSATNISIMLQWKRPVAPNGPILGYTVSWKATYGGGSPQVAAVQSILQHNITDLLPYENYSIQVSAKTSAGSGPWSDTLVASTKIGVPKPAQVSYILVENSKSISVEWSTTNPYPGPTTYVLEVWRKPSHCNPGSDAILETFKEGPRGSGEWRFTKPETIEGLTPYSEYYVRIVLKTSVAGSTSSNSSVVKTPPDSPGAPRKVEAECKESTETVVRWKTPLFPNGKIIEYLVRYGVEYSGWSEEAVFVEDECQENHSLRLIGLRPERKYKIYVRAKAQGVEENGAEASIKGYCELPAGIPPVGDINSLTIHGSGPYTLSLEWNKNVFSDTMGDIIHYAVIVGVSEAVGNATSGRIAETFPSWSNYSGGLTSFYQATPLEWNPFEEEQEDPLHCEEIKAEEPERKTFIRCTIGVDKECSSAKPYCNGPLKPDSRYGVKLRAFTSGGFSETDPLYTITDPIKGPSSIVGVIVGVIIVLLMLSAFIAFTLILKRKGKLVEFRLAILARFGRQPTAPQLPTEQVLQLEACPTVVPLTIRNFANHVRLMMSDSHLRFSQEFETLKKNSPKYPCSIAEMDENRPKNRWLNIFPYDHSRVKLLPLGDEPGSDFVNANYVPGNSSLREYIATQGPLANTVDDFWRMIWEQSVSMIVMLTQCVERGKNKCEQYWPAAGEAKHYGDMQVRTISESMLSSYIIRLFHVQLGSQERRVKQMHFTHWPDFGCPESPDDLINFIRAVRDHLPRFKPGPIVVHCSAGVGRTGTFMAVDRLSQQLRSTDTIDIFGTVMELRHHRINMVQTEDQYIYIHLCVKQLVDDINQPHESEYEEAIYSNIGMEKDTGV